MKEPLFVKQNLANWEAFEEAIKDTSKVGADRLADLYVVVTNDLAFARTKYPNSKTTAYLNQLASKLHHAIYRNKKEKSSRFITFWTQELPLIHFEARKQLLYSFLFFTVAVLIGVVSSAHDLAFARLILGDGYINMTLENIKEGNPMGVYESMDQITMFVVIAANNVYVMLGVFFTGIFISLGTILRLFLNGVMVGVFQYFFIQEGLFWISFLTIWTHGTLEISAIIISGAAGLVLGNSILFPGTYSRLNSFKFGAKKGLKIIIGLVPVILVAAFLEGFVTRLTDFHWSFKATIILLSALFIAFYYIIYPIRISKNVSVQTD